jgi:hypothetical protein
MRALVLVSCLIARAALGQETSPPPTTQPAKKPILQAIDPAVEKWWIETREPCKKPINLGVPCFPVEIHAEGPTVSVRDSLWDLGGRAAPSKHSAPTLAEMAPMRPGSQTPTIGVSFDPVCAAKAALKAVKGRNNTYFLYRLHDTSGERVVMRDAKLDTTTYQGAAEFLGEYHGECEAIAAFRHEDRRTPAPTPTGPPK